MKGIPGIYFKIARDPREFKDAEHLFREYAASLDVDLSFQGFESELTSIGQQYSRPKGALLLACMGDLAIGCVGLRPWDRETAELKRMFVRPAYRGYKIGHRLLELIIDIAKELQYKCIRLDTLPGMTEAQRLYRSYGFSEIPPYRFNPVEGTVFMEKKLV